MNDSQKTFYGYINGDGIIFAKSSTYGNPDSDIGIDNQLRDELTQDRDNCVEKAGKYLEELYAIYEKTKGEYGRKRPKTPEQIAQEQTEINTLVLSTLKDLKDEISSLKSQLKEEKKNAKNTKLE